MVKRIAEKQMRKEDGSDDEDDYTAVRFRVSDLILNQGAVQADKEVIAKRRIVKGRHFKAAVPPSSAVGAGAEKKDDDEKEESKPNPFASLQKKDEDEQPKPNPFAALARTGEEKTDEESPPNPFASLGGKKPEPVVGLSESSKADTPKKDAEKSKDEPVEAEPSVQREEGAKEEEKKEKVADGFMSQIPKTNPFASLAAAPSSTSAFSVALSSKPDEKSDDKESAPLFQFTPSPALFSATTADKQEEATSPVQKPKVDVAKTGEEDESTLFQVRGKLFKLAKDGWHERGVGAIHVNTGKDGVTRVVMRRDGNYSLILNARIFKKMAVSRMNDKNIRLVCMDHEDGQWVTFLLRCARVDETDELLEAIELCKEKASD